MSAAVSWVNDMAMSSLVGKYMVTVRGATSARSAMSAMVAPSYPRSANKVSAARWIARLRLIFDRSRSDWSGVTITTPYILQQSCS